MKKNIFEPGWRKTPPGEKSFRSIFKWGSPDKFKHPNKRLYKLIKEVFDLTDKDFKKNVFNYGDEKIKTGPKIKISDNIIKKLEKICLKKNVETDIYSRAKYSYGKTLEESLELRNMELNDLTDVVVHPKNKNEIIEIVSLCNNQKIPLHIFSGGSSVTLGLKCSQGGVTIVMSTHMKRVIEFNEKDQTITIEPGIYGPNLERLLNYAPQVFNAKRKYTCGHFPQSFEYSTAGGWAVTLGSGQASTYYGDAKDLVISQEYITPRGKIKTHDFPASATGPDINGVFLGSEGIFGILVEIKLKIFRFMPENRKKFAFIFPSWKNAAEASREIIQSQGGSPAVFRISDPEETDIAMKLYGIEGSPIDSFIKIKGLKPNQRCLCIGHTEGSKNYSYTTYKNIKKISKQYKGLYITGYPFTKWEHGRFEDPYMREDINDFGLYIDTLETSVKWSNFHKVYNKVRAHIKKRPQTICMTHASHFYPQGTNLYFIFIARFNNRAEYMSFQRSIIKKIHESGGSLSHHHGIGKMMAPLFRDYIGENEFNMIKVLKNYFDENNIMNSKGILGID